MESETGEHMNTYLGWKMRISFNDVCKRWRACSTEGWWLLMGRRDEQLYRKDKGDYVRRGPEALPNHLGQREEKGREEERREERRWVLWYSLHLLSGFQSPTEVKAIRRMFAAKCLNHGSKSSRGVKRPSAILTEGWLRGGRDGHREIREER